MHISIRSENEKDQIQTNKPRKENWIIDFLDIETKSDSSWRSMCRKPPHMTKCCFVKSLILTAAAVLQILSGVSWSMWGILAWNPIWYSIMYHVQCMIPVVYHVSVHCIIHVFADNQICWNPQCTMMGLWMCLGQCLNLHCAVMSLSMCLGQCGPSDLCRWSALESLGSDLIGSIK